MRDPGQRGPRQPAGRRRGRIIYWGLSGLAAVILAGGLATAGATTRTFTEPSTSMEPAIRPGDRLVVVTHVPVRRGEVIVEQQPPSDDYFVRRVIGLPGDRVACCTGAGQVTVNGKVLHETYLPAGTTPSQLRFHVTVPPGRLWLMGDNRLVASDSRLTGPAAARVVGSVVLVMRPGSRPVFLHTPQTFITDGLAPAGQPVPPGVIGAAAAVAAFAVLVVLLIIGAVTLLRRSRRGRAAENPAR
jgi:signal peptidase I